MATNLYGTQPNQSDAPAVGAFAITPNDSTDLAYTTRGIYVGVGGDISLYPAYNGGTAVVFKGAQTGSIIPIMATRVKATGTTATDLVALY